MSAQRSSIVSVAGERGIALLTTILMMVLMSALLVGFTTAVMSDQAYRSIDRDRARAFYGAQSGIEKQNADLAKLFINQVGPTDAQITALGAAANRPSIPNVTFVDIGTSPAYQVAPLGPATNGIISSGPYEGLMALKRQFQLDATARAVDGGEVHLKRIVETVAIPVFQFGIFSDVDLSFSAAANFDFGGRVHTNANLFLAQSTVGSLILRDKVTAVGQIVRQRLSNGESIDASGSTGTVSMTRGNSTGPFRTLARTEGSVVDGPTSALNSSWPTISLSTYVGNIRNARTGVRPLNLDLVTANGANIDLIRRPPASEAASSAIFAERYFKKVSLRILLSDEASDITSLPTVSAGAPVLLDGDWRTAPPAGYGPVPAVAVTLPAGGAVPVARSAGPILNAPLGTSANANVNAGVTASSTASSAVGSGANITLNPGIADQFRVPANMRIVTPGGVELANTINCTGKTANTFTGCARPSGSASVVIPAGSLLTGTTRTIDPVVVQTALNNITLPSGTTAFTLTASAAATTFPTAPFSVNTFFIRDEPHVVTCMGYTNNTTFNLCNVPVALTTTDRIETGYLSNATTGTIGGYLKVELQNNAGTWIDVTSEFLSYGISGPNLQGRPCDDPTPNAIIRLQRMRDNNEPSALAKCTYNGSTLSTDHWPNTFFDAREGVVRDLGTGGPAGHNGRVVLGGVMHYVELDVQNLSRWFNRTGAYAAGSGNLAMREGASPTGGYSVYFSDRRNNRDSGGEETGEYGWEDVVNPADVNGAPNGTLQTGEDFNASGTLQNYGQFPSMAGNYNSLPANPVTLPAGIASPLSVNTARPWAFIGGGQAKVNRATHFRRALKLTKGSLGQIVAPGLTVAAENPVYVQGDWNASVGAGWGDPHVATSVAADAVTLLSNNWNDVNSYGTATSDAYNVAARPRSSDTYYRLAIISGKGPVFPRPGGAGATYGTDGGAHSFLRFIEGNSSGGNNRIWYRGSMVTFYYNRQSVHPFKCCNNMVYGVPVREYAFDIDFLDPAKLPPLTPVFRDLNALGFTQETRPGK